MKRLLPLPICLLCTVLLSSCVYDPYASSHYGNSHGHYHGGYHNGFFSDYYIGIHKTYYRYRHTRCSHCSHYPCRGGHRTNYHTYYRDYRKPLHGGDRAHHDRGNGRDRDHRMGDSGKPRSRSVKETSRLSLSDPQHNLPFLSGNRKAPPVSSSSNIKEPPRMGDSGKPRSRSVKETSRLSLSDPRHNLPFLSGNRKAPPVSSSSNMKEPSSNPRSFTTRKTPPKLYPSAQPSPTRTPSGSRPSRSRPERTSRPAPSASPKTYPKTQKSSEKSAPSKKD